MSPVLKVNMWWSLHYICSQVTTEQVVRSGHKEFEGWISNGHHRSFPCALRDQSLWRAGFCYGPTTKRYKIHFKLSLGSPHLVHSQLQSFFWFSHNGVSLAFESAWLSPSSDDTDLHSPTRLCNPAGVDCVLTLGTCGILSVRLLIVFSQLKPQRYWHTFQKLCHLIYVSQMPTKEQDFLLPLYQWSD